MRGKYLKYPLRAEDIILKLCLGTAFNVLLFFILEKLNWRKARYGPFGPNMEQWSVSNFGRGLHRLFFKPYTEQFWNISCSELSPSCIPTYKSLSFWQTVKTLLLSKIRKDNLTMIDREKMTLYYPENGFGTMCTSLADRIEGTRLGNIHLGTQLSSIDQKPNGDYVIRAQKKNGDLVEIETEHLISTIPISSLFNAIDFDVPEQVVQAANQLNYLSLISLYIIIEKQNTLGCMYQYCLNYPYNRIADVNEVTLTPRGSRKLNALSIEKSCRYGDDWWNKKKEELLEIYLPFLEKDGIIKREDVVDLGLMKAAYAYPMPTYDFETHLSKVQEYISLKEKLYLLGRTGTFKYADFDQTLESGFNVADMLINDESKRDSK
jgi:protoporphyrinogen oxidase